MKKIITATLTFFLVIVLLSGCGKKDYGEIKSVDIEKSYGVEQTLADGSTPKSYFTGYDNKLNYKYKTIDVGAAQLRFPYPSSWEVKKTTDYNICFIAPGDDPYFPGQRIYFHSNFQRETPHDHSTVRTHFERWIGNDEFKVAGKTVHLLPNSEIEKVVVNEDIADPNYQTELSYRDWDAKTYPRTYELYHQSTTFYWRYIPCILSGMTTKEHADDLNNLLLYMMSHSEYINNYIASVEKVHIFNDTSDIRLKLCPLLQQDASEMNTLEGYYKNVAQFSCPADSGTGYSQVKLSFYEVEKKKWQDLNSEDDFDAYFREVLLSNTFGPEVYEAAEFAGTFSKTGGTMDFPQGEKDEYMYSFTIHNVNNDEYFDGQKWITDFYVFDDSKDYVNIVAVTGKESSLWWMMDIMEFTSVTLKVGGK